jgi:flagellar biosynthesis protein FlhG
VGRGGRCSGAEDVTRGNHYAVLGIEPGATPEEIERAHGYLTELYGDESLATYSLLEEGEARQIRAQVREAYEVLRDPLRRLEYDARQGLISTQRERAARDAPEPEDGPVDEGEASEPGDEMATEEGAAPGVADGEGEAPPDRAPSRAQSGPVTLPGRVTGEALRAFREGRGVSLREIADTTKVSLRYLEYIETDRHEFLPAAVYLRGFVQEYARIVGLEPRHTAERYLAHSGKSIPGE